MTTADKPKARKRAKRAKTLEDRPKPYRGADNPNNPHARRLPEHPVVLEPNPLTKKQAKDVAAGRIRDPRLAGKKSRRPRQNRWVRA